eukprot:290033-Chlamydomonas_euryale.AAC.1
MLSHNNGAAKHAGPQEGGYTASWPTRSFVGHWTETAAARRVEGSKGWGGRRGVRQGAEEGGARRGGGRAGNGGGGVGNGGGSAGDQGSRAWNGGRWWDARRLPRARRRRLHATTPPPRSPRLWAA